MSATSWLQRLAATSTAKDDSPPPVALPRLDQEERGRRGRGGSGEGQCRSRRGSRRGDLVDWGQVARNETWDTGNLNLQSNARGSEGKRVKLLKNETESPRKYTESMMINTTRWCDTRKVEHSRAAMRLREKIFTRNASQGLHVGKFDWDNYSSMI